MATPSPTRCFEAALLVTLEGLEDAIKFCYPPGASSSALVRQAPAFCFPEQQAFRTSILLLNTRESFTFTLTRGDGSHVFAYCRRSLIQAVPTCLCILTLLPSFGLFSDILNVVESLSIQRGAYQILASFFAELESRSAPPPGQSMTMHFQFPPPRGDTQSFKFFRPSGCNLLEDFISFYALFDSLGVKLTVRLWECLMMERRIILCSKQLGTLTSAINAAIASLNPFVWQQILIPVLPNSLLDYCAAPMPFLMGVLPSSLQRMRALPLEEVYIFHLDERSLTAPKPFVHFLPKSIRASLKTDLERVLRPESFTAKQQRAKDISIARCFLEVIAKVMDGYTEFFDSRSPRFDQRAFLSAPSSYRKTRELLAETQMFSCFCATQQELYQEGTLQNCILQRMQEWDNDGLLYACTRCRAAIGRSETFLYKGDPVCKSCHQRKQKKSKSTSSHTTAAREEGRGLQISLPVACTKREFGNAFGMALPALHPSGPGHQRRNSDESLRISPRHFVARPPSTTQRPRGISPAGAKRGKAPKDSSLSLSQPKVPGRATPVAQPRPPAWNSANAHIHTDVRRASPDTPRETPPSPGLIKGPPARGRGAPGRGAARGSGSISPGGSPVVRRPSPSNGQGSGRLTLCAGCQKGIARTPESVTIQALQRAWHPTCFVCAACRQPFDMTFTFKVHDNRPYHPACGPSRAHRM